MFKKSIFGIGTNALYLATALLIGLAQPISAQTDTEVQQPGKRYAVDFWLGECSSRSSKSDTAALAVSKIGVWHCATNRKLRRAESAALSKCDKLVPRDMREKAPCRIIAVDDEILNITMVNRLRQETRLPVDLEIYDGDTKKRQGMAGAMIFGEALSLTTRKLRVENNNGALICDGTFKHAKRKISVSMNCFGRFKFKDQRSKSSGYFLSKDIYTPIFAIELKHNKSTIKIKPQE